jgi:hypothetical protein
MSGPSTPPNQQAFIDTWNYARKWNANAYVEDSPTPYRDADLLNFRRSDDDFEEDVDAYIPRILGGLVSR